MIKNLIAAILLSASATVAGGVMYSWTAPTNNVDGSVLQAEDIMGYSLRYSIDGVAYPEIFIPAEQLTMTLPAKSGEWAASVATITAAGMSEYTEDFTLIVEGNTVTPSATIDMNFTITCNEQVNCSLEIK